MSETDLYAPIASHLRAQGYTVHSEVEHCDITAVKGDELVVIELKRAFSTALLIQATKRQRITDSVYVALPRPKWSRTWLGIQHVLKRLELGLILVSFNGKQAEVQIPFHPLPFRRQKQRRQTRAVLREMGGRSGDFNQGGSTRRKLMTAYREHAIQVACCLERFGAMSAKALRALGTCPKTYGILRRDVYQWFEHVRPGLYDLRAPGREELDRYPEVAARYREWAQGLQWPQEPPPPAPKPARKRAGTRRAKQGKPAAGAKVSGKPKRKARVSGLKSRDNKAAKGVGDADAVV